MKTITIIISISEEVQEPLTIKSSIQEQILFHLREKTQAEKIIRELKSQAREMLSGIKEKLNEKVGANLWYTMDDRLEVQFRGVIIRAEYSSEKITFGNIEYYKPSAESLKLEILFPNVNGSYVATPLKDLEEVHRLSEKNYINYFTTKV